MQNCNIKIAVQCLRIVQIKGSINFERLVKLSTLIGNKKLSVCLRQPEMV